MNGLYVLIAIGMFLGIFLIIALSVEPKYTQDSRYINHDPDTY